MTRTKKPGIRISVSDIDGDENTEVTNLLNGILAGRQLDIQLEPELVAAIVKKTANHFEASKILEADNGYRIKTGVIADTLEGKNLIKVKNIKCEILMFNA